MSKTQYVCGARARVCVCAAERETETERQSYGHTHAHAHTRTERERERKRERERERLTELRSVVLAPIHARLATLAAASRLLEVVVNPLRPNHRDRQRERERERERERRHCTLHHSAQQPVRRST